MVLRRVLVSYPAANELPVLYRLPALVKGGRESRSKGEIEGIWQLP